jgi:hypothetical protein
MTGFWGVFGEGSSGDSLLIRQSANHSGESLLLPSPSSP